MPILQSLPCDYQRRRSPTGGLPDYRRIPASGTLSYHLTSPFLVLKPRRVWPELKKSERSTGDGRNLPTPILITTFASGSDDVNVGQARPGEAETDTRILSPTNHERNRQV
jgi:hypothetical protein